MCISMCRNTKAAVLPAAYDAIIRIRGHRVNRNVERKCHQFKKSRSFFRNQLTDMPGVAAAGALPCEVARTSG
jgi:hypothetical protein